MSTGTLERWNAGTGKGWAEGGTVTGRHLQNGEFAGRYLRECLTMGRDMRGMGEIGRIPQSAVSHNVVTRQLGVLAAAIPSTPGTIPSFSTCQLFSPKTVFRVDAFCLSGPTGLESTRKHSIHHFTCSPCSASSQCHPLLGFSRPTG